MNTTVSTFYNQKRSAQVAAPATPIELQGLLPAAAEAVFVEDPWNEEDLRSEGLEITG